MAAKIKFNLNALKFLQGLKTLQIKYPETAKNIALEFGNEAVKKGRQGIIPRQTHNLASTARVEIEENAAIISKTGIKHLLILTGESRKFTPISYMKEAVETLKKYFSSISIEVYPLETKEYRELKEAGVDGLTIYQEVYNRTIYGQVHLSGKKKDYNYRLGTPERGGEAGLRSINIGALFGLGDPLSEAFFTGLHAKFLQDNYQGSEISVSFPRINSAEGDFKSIIPLSDREMVRVMLACRLFLPKAGIVLSTRENASFRDNLLPLGVTRMSAGSITSVGGYSENGNTPQFEVSDTRSVIEIRRQIESKGYEPVFKDWEMIS